MISALPDKKTTPADCISRKSRIENKTRITILSKIIQRESSSQCLNKQICNIEANLYKPLALQSNIKIRKIKSKTILYYKEKTKPSCALTSPLQSLFQPLPTSSIPSPQTRLRPPLINPCSLKIVQLFESS